MKGKVILVQCDREETPVEGQEDEGGRGSREKSKGVGFQWGKYLILFWEVCTIKVKLKKDRGEDHIIITKEEKTSNGSPKVCLRVAKFQSKTRDQNPGNKTWPGDWEPCPGEDRESRFGDWDLEDSCPEQPNRFQFLKGYRCFDWRSFQT